MQISQLGVRPTPRVQGAAAKPLKQLLSSCPPLHRSPLSCSAQNPSGSLLRVDRITKERPQGGNTGSLYSVELLDRTLTVKDLDAAWNLILRLRESYEEITPSQIFGNPGVEERRAGLMGRNNSRPKLFLSKCIEAKRSDLVFEYFRHFPRDGHLMPSVMKQCLQLKRFETICQLTDLQTALQMQPDAYTFNAHISALTKLNRLRDAREIFEKAVAFGEDSIYVYNTMLDGYARVGDVRGSEEIWSRILKAGLDPDSVSYVGILRAYGSQGDFKKVQKLFSEMEAKRLKPMPHAYTVLFDCVAKAATDVDLKWLMDVVQTVEKGPGMNQHILSSMVNAFSRQHLKEAHVQFVFAAFRDFRDHASPGNNVYCAVLNFCIRQGVPERALDIWGMIKEDGLTPNGHVYSSLLKACCAIQNRPLTKLIAEISKRLRTDWKRSSYRRDAESEMRVAFNTLLHFHAGLENADDALSVYRSMKKHGPSPDQITFNSVLSAVDAVDLKSGILKDMDRAGCGLNAKTYGILLNACSDAHDVDEARAWLEDMVHSGIHPTVECYTALIDTCVKEGSPRSLQLAFDYFDLLKQRGLRPTEVTYGCLLLAYKAQDDIDGAFELYQEACKCGVSPSDKCHNILISMCTEVGRLDDALDLIKALVRKHGDIAEDTMNSLVRALSLDYLPRSLVLLRMMDHRSMVPSPETFHCLILACCRASNIQQAFSLYRAMVLRRLPVKPSAGSALIKSLSKAGEVLAALRVTNTMFEKAGLPLIDPASIRLMQSQRPSPSRRKERIMLSAMPSVLSLGSLVMALALKNKLQTAMYLFRQICMLNKKGLSGVRILVRDAPQVFELLIELTCIAGRVDWAIEVFIKWSKAAERISKGKQKGDGDPIDKRDPKISLASLAFLHATCKRTPGYESHIWSICKAMRNQELQNEAIPRKRTVRRRRLNS